ncbi:MAG: TolC family outer membrane protein [Nevskiaceae bacterium]|jgi:outer membrane protein|nr:TolC family outer membrane protein [Nevskiaceae bacterium]
MKKNLLVGFAVALGLTASAVQAEDLLQVFDLAAQNDPLIREAEATRDANKQARPQALGALLPQLSASGNLGRAESKSISSQTQVVNDQLVSFDNGGRNTTDNTGWNLNLRQSVFSYANWTALRTANHSVAQAEADFMAAQQSLAQRVAQQYFAVLAAADDVDALESSREAIQRQLDQSERRFEVGLIAITDVQEARAARDQAAAQVIASKRILASSLEQLRATIGVKPDVLKKPQDNMPLASPQPADEDAWVNMSMEQNATLISSRLAADIARDGVSTSFSGHLPTLDLTASRSYSDADSTRELTTGVNSGTRLPNSSTSNNTNIGLQLNLPLFSGGTTQSRVKESQYRWIAAKERLERTSRQTEQQARDAYLGVMSEITRVQALQQAVQSNQTALQAAEAGYEVGTRTTVDVLNARRNLIQAQTAYSQARYSYINNQVQLRLAAGNLDRSMIEEINRALLVDAPVGNTARAPTPVATPPAQN